MLLTANILHSVLCTHGLLRGSSTCTVRATGHTRKPNGLHHMVYGVMHLWSNGSMDQWIYGLVVLWGWVAWSNTEGSRVTWINAEYYTYSDTGHGYSGRSAMGTT